MKKRFISILLSLALMAAFVMPVGATSELKTVRVGFFELSGFFEKDSDGGYSGYGYDYVVEMAKYENWELEFVEGDFDGLQYKLADDKTVDMMIGLYHYDEYDQYFDYSSLSVGTGRSMLTTRSDNDSLNYENYGSLQDKRIGFLDDRYKCEEFAELSRQKGFSYTEVMYQSSERLYQALEAGDVDAVVANDVFISENEKLLFSFSYRNYYVITRKGDTLMNEINDSLAKISETKPSFQSELYSKFYLRNEVGVAHVDVADFMTRAEKDYVASAKVLTVGISEYVMTDDETGLDSCMAASIVQIYETIAEQTGLKFRFTTVSGIEEAIDLANSGEIDIIGIFPQKVSLAEENNITLTDSLMTLYFNMVCNKKVTLGDMPMLSLVRGHYYNGIITDRNPDSSVLYADSYRGAIRAVDDGSAEVAIINRYVAEELLASADFNNVYSVSSAYSENVTCGISKSNSPLLISIMNKSVACFSAEEIAEIVESNRLLYPSKPTLYSFISTHPLFSVAFTAIFVLVIVSMLLAAFNQRRIKRDRKTKDLLTGLCNIDGFLINGQKLLDANPRSTFVLSSFDIKHFNYITSVFGLERGNDVIRFVAATLDGELAGKYIVAHGSGSDFIVMYECLNPEYADSFADKLQEKLNLYEHAQSENYLVQICSGSVMIDIDRPRFTLSELLERSIAAQVSIKDSAVRNIFFTEEMLEEEAKTRALIKQFSDAIESREFHIFLQPVHSMTDNERVVGAELLTRWVKPDHTVIYPDEFINALVSCNSIIRFDEYVLESACEFITSNAVLPDDFKLSVNISNTSALQPEFAEHCAMLKKSADIPDGKITLEFSESVVFTNIEAFKTLFKKLHAAGFNCSVDNFGSGNASLRKLGELCADEIKLDRSFFNAPDDASEQRSEAVVAGILSIAAACNISTTAIGIDRVSQLRFLIGNGCRRVQGYIYAKPMEKERFSAYFRNFRPAFGGGSCGAENVTVPVIRATTHTA